MDWSALTGLQPAPAPVASVPGAGAAQASVSKGLVVLAVGGAAALLAGLAALAIRTPAPATLPRPRRPERLVPKEPEVPSPTAAPAMSPADARLLQQKFTSRDVEAAARMIASENPSGPEQAKVEQIWTQLRAKRPSESLYDQITAGLGWGAQGGRRPAATSKPAMDADRTLAWDVLRGKRPSQLAGARKFFDPAQEDKVYRQVTKARADLAEGKDISKRSRELLALGYQRTAEGVRQEWQRKGGKPVATIGPVEFWT